MLSTENLIALSVLGAAVFVLFMTAPADGAFYWSDAPRHALNGVFVKDLLQAMPFEDPKGFAYDYYARYPALTILFYPPLFYFVSAPFFFIFGATHEAALSAVGIHYMALALGTFTLARNWLSASGAIACALLLIGLPEIAFWGRQVMLEIPAYSFVVWSAVFLVSYRRQHDIWRLYSSIILIVLALYTKLSVAFLLPVFLMYLIIIRGKYFFTDRHTYIIGILFLLSLAPLAYVTLEFGQANVQSVSGIVDREVDRFSLEGWLWYLVKMPQQTGWAVLACALVGILMHAIKPRWNGPRADLFLLLAWFIVGYLFYSAIDLKEARHSIFILLPVCVFAINSLYQLLPKRMAIFSCMALAIGTFVTTLWLRPVLFVDGYREAAEAIADLAPHDSVVMFSGYRDGAFIFNIRGQEQRPDLSVLRADKLLLKISVRRELGVEQKQYSETEIAQLLDAHAVHYVVAQPNFWVDLEQMQKLQNVLHSDHFEEVTRIRTRSNFNAQDQELVLYKNLGNVARGPVKIELDLPIIGRTIESSLGNSSGAKNEP